ncbi:hypothetical protein EJB05_26747, partial [Eragrostis curvula]
MRARCSSCEPSSSSSPTRPPRSLIQPQRPRHPRRRRLDLGALPVAANRPDILLIPMEKMQGKSEQMMEYVKKLQRHNTLRKTRFS